MLILKKNDEKSRTYDHRLNREVASLEHPERPAGEPAEALLEREREDGLLEDRAQDGPVVTFVRARDGDRELEVVELTEADAHGVLEAVAEDEECSGED